MPSFDDPAPIATTDDFKRALLSVRDRMTDMHLNMLRAHCQAPEHTITATRLAEAVRLPTCGAANLQYGTYAHWVADALGYVPDQRDDGSYNGWRTLAYGRAASIETQDGHFEWIMRPELVEALRSMRWA
jgi:hypothetical protein